MTFFTKSVKINHPYQLLTLKPIAHTPKVHVSYQKYCWQLFINGNKMTYEENYLQLFLSQLCPV